MSPRIVKHGNDPALAAGYARAVMITRVPCVGAVVRDGLGRLLLVKRGHEPGRGLWSVPGGRVEAGEEHRAAAVREVAEETGVEVVLDGLAGIVERPGAAGIVYTIEDFFAHLAPGADPESIRPGDDADEVGWFYPDEVEQLACVEGLVHELALWRVIPRQR